MDTIELHKLILALPTHVSQEEERAMVILSGGGSSAGDSRLLEAEWNCKNVWVAGTRGDPAYTREEVEGLLLRDGRIPEKLLFQGDAKHTPDQVAWVTDQLLVHPQITHLVWSTAKYHLPRGVLTFVKWWIQRGDNRQLRLSVQPTSNPAQINLSSATSQTLGEELKRIEEYQRKGDVATGEEFEQFLMSSH